MTSEHILARRRFLMQAGSGVLAMVLSRAGVAAAWPSRPIRFVTASGAGDPVDLQLRDYLKSLSQELGNVPAIVENKVGAAGQIAAQSVLLAPPEGYDVLLANATSPSRPAISASCPIGRCRTSRRSR